MTRRELISLLGGVTVSWPLAARAQQPQRVRRIGVLMSTVESDPRGLELITAFAQGLAELGWTVGRNVRIEYRWGAGDLDRFRSYAAELVALSPDVVLATAGSIVGALQQANRTVPIVFVTTIDPVGGGWVESLSRPGTNATGFAAYEFSMSGKRLELLKEIAPGVKRMAVIRWRLDLLWTCVRATTRVDRGQPVPRRQRDLSDRDNAPPMMLVPPGSGRRSNLAQRS
jgi:ABC-type uncharacterized transport system substrate-binding protein